jgi:hypothetical protein
MDFDRSPASSNASAAESNGSDADIRGFASIKLTA